MKELFRRKPKEGKLLLLPAERVRSPRIPVAQREEPTVILSPQERRGIAWQELSLYTATGGISLWADKVTHISALFPLVDSLSRNVQVDVGIVTALVGARMFFYGQDVRSHATEKTLFATQIDHSSPDHPTA